MRDQYDLTIPLDAPPGEYQIEVGMYVAETGEQLPVFNADGRVEDKRMLLGTVWVEEP